MLAEVSDAQWACIVPFLPPKRQRGRPPADDRRTLIGILWVLRSGARWCDLPLAYGSDSTCHRRLQEWQERWVWERIWTTSLSTLEAQGKLEWEKAFLDGSFVSAKKGALPSGVGGKGKGSAAHLLRDGAGTPLAVVVSGAHVHEQRVALLVVDSVRVPRLRGRPKQRPQTVAADKGYDSKGLRSELRKLGIRPSIPQRKWPGRRNKPWRPPKVHAASAIRWTVERTHAWMDAWRRLVVRWERRARNYIAFLVIACFMLCLRVILG